MSLLTEIANYDEPGSWGRMSQGWPEIHGDVALALYVHANKTGVIPYGSYVLMSERGRYGTKESCLRVHPDHIKRLEEFMIAAAPSPGESNTTARDVDHG